MTEVYYSDVCPRCGHRTDAKLVQVRRQDIPGKVKVYKSNLVMCRNCKALSREDRRAVWLATHGWDKRK